MLKEIKPSRPDCAGLRFAIVASEYNDEYVGPMLTAAAATLETGGAAQVDIIRVPGAYEVPLAARTMAARSAPPHAVICLGVILRGETTHAQFIGESVTHALMTLQMQTGIPMIHEVLLLENRKQAEVRCQDPRHNRGMEAAQTAMAMARLIGTLR